MVNGKRSNPKCFLGILGGSFDAIDQNEILGDHSERAERLRRFLEEEVWPRVPADQLGRTLTSAELSEILGYGPDGVSPEK